MLVLGLSGGLDRVFANRDYLFQPGTCHDAAAVLVEEGRVLVAIEEERLNRIKHTSKGAINAISHCLRSQSIRLSDLDHLVYYGSEEACNAWMRNLFYSNRDAEPVVTYRQLIHELLQQGLGEDIDDAKLGFVNHHLTHAISAYAQSGFSEALVLTIDGAGDALSGSVTRWRGSNYELLVTYPEASSLGTFYLCVIAMIGYGFTEEYKVMGLAPYGDATRFKAAFDRLYDLLPGGAYVVHWHMLPGLYQLAPVRKKGQPILQDHKDIAAGLQEALERIVFHVLAHYRRHAGMAKLCLAGGVAHNSTMNGKLLSSGLFDDVFVQPASSDSGCAIGAALYPFMAAGAGHRYHLPARIEHVFWGTDAGSDADIGAALHRWRAVVDVEPEPDIARRCAALLAEGEVIGWVQGRGEFGPRALGHRSIVADPRPASHKDLINGMVKKREGYRPFAPAVLEECVADYFEVPRQGMTFPFMSFTLKVRPEHRELLGATTHVDHTARVQTVSKQVDPLFWELIDAFRQYTGVPVLLNTSFNNHAEPIVDTVDDAVTCFLTTGLQRLAVGRHLVSKIAHGPPVILQMYVSLPGYARLTEIVAQGEDGRCSTTHAIANSYNRHTIRISAEAYELLKHANGELTVAEQLGAQADGAADLAAELWNLWEQRAIAARPAP
jgi:carbamoyltransferase